MVTILILAVFAGLIVSCIVCPKAFPAHSEDLVLLEGQVKANQELARQVRARLQACIVLYKGHGISPHSSESLQLMLDKVNREYHETVAYDTLDSVSLAGTWKRNRRMVFRKTGDQFIALLSLKKEVESLMHQ